jgi:hypothetical protein
MARYEVWIRGIVLSADDSDVVLLAYLMLTPRQEDFDWSINTLKSWRAGQNKTANTYVIEIPL